MQRADQHIQVDLNDKDHTYTGNTRIAYVNNSGDALDEVYFHLYPNAFKPGSEMDVRSRQLPDPDPRILDRISKLSPSEEGELRVTSFLQDGKVAEVTHLGTIMRVKLPQPIKVGKRTVFEFEFKGQVPVQIRRSGRNNAEGVAIA